jgi:hypothetical protein
MKDIFAGVVVFISSVVGLIVLIGGLSYLGWMSYDYFAPKYRATDNKVFKESEQYNDGMLRDLENLQMEYTNADQAHKDALRAIILHRFSVYDENRLPYNLRNFYAQLRSGK